MPRAVFAGGVLDWRNCAMTDIDQLRFSSPPEGKVGLPEDGRNYCLPTSALNALVDIARRGYSIPGVPADDPLLPDNYSLFSEAVRALGAEMNTDPMDGTGGEDAVSALQARLSAAKTTTGPGQLSAVIQAFTVAHEKGDAPDPHELGVSGGTGSYVLPIIGFHSKLHGETSAGVPVDFLQRRFGHAMTGVGMTFGKAGPMRMLVHDPATDWVADTVQSDYHADSHTLEPRMLRVQKRTELPNGGYKITHSPPVERWIWDGNDTTLYEGFIRIGPVEVWGTAGSKLRVASSDPLTPVVAPHPDAYSVPGGAKVIDLALSAVSSGPLFVTSKGNGVWTLNPLTGAAKQVVKTDNASALAVGGPTQNLFVAAGKRLTSFTHSGHKIGTRKLSASLSALEFDSPSGRLVGLSREGNKLLFFRRGLKPAGSRVLGKAAQTGPGQLAIGPGGAIAVTQPGAVVMLKHAKAGAATAAARGGPLRKVKLPRKGIPRGLAIDDDGHVLMTQRGRLVEYSPGGKLVSDSPFAGRRVGRVLAVSRSFSNSGDVPIDSLPFAPSAPTPPPPAPSGPPDLTLTRDDSTHITVRNIGTGPVGPFTVRLHPDDTILSFSGLAAGGHETRVVVCGPGTRAVVDPDNLVAESDETNNFLSGDCPD